MTVAFSQRAITPRPPSDDPAVHYCSRRGLSGLGLSVPLLDALMMSGINDCRSLAELIGQTWPGRRNWPLQGVAWGGYRSLCLAAHGGHHAKLASLDIPLALFARAVRANLDRGQDGRICWWRITRLAPQHVGQLHFAWVTEQESCGHQLTLADLRLEELDAPPWSRLATCGVPLDTPLTELPAVIARVGRAKPIDRSRPVDHKDAGPVHCLNLTDLAIYYLAQIGLTIRDGVVVAISCPVEEPVDAPSGG